MIIFARKHFQGRTASLFVLMLQAAIYLRAFITLISNFLKKIRLPFLDAIVIYTGLFGLKIFWELYYYKTPNHFEGALLYFNYPLYILIWLISVYIRRLVRGLLVGTVLIAAVYGFLDSEYRSSRALIVMGMVWAITATVALRMLLHFTKYHNFNVGN